MEWAAEGGKEWFWVGIRKSLGKSKAFGLLKWVVFETSKERLVRKKSFLYVKKAAFADSKKLFE